MKINFKNVHLHNFMSFADASINLDSCSFAMVSGINNNPLDAAKSNGSGKSAIFDAIVWALTGTTVRGCKDVKNLYADDGAFVELEFEINHNHYKIIRSKDHSEYKTNLKIYVNGVDKSGKGIRDSEKILSELLPDLTADLIGSVIVLGQGLPSRFTNNTPSGRKDVLEKLSKSDFMIEDLKKRVLERKEVIAQRIRMAEDEQLKANTQIEVVKKAMASAEEYLNNLPDKTALENALVAFDDSLAVIQSTIDAENCRLTDLNSQLVDITTKSNEFTMAYNQKLQDIEKDFRTRIAVYNDELNALLLDTAAANTLKSQKTKELAKMKSVTDVCPTCGQKLIGVQKPDTSAIEAEIADIESQLQKLNKNTDDINAQIRGVQDECTNATVAYKASVQYTLNEFSTMMSQCNAQIKEKQQSLQTRRAEFMTTTNTRNQLKSKLDGIEANVAASQKTIADGQLQIKECEVTISKYAEQLTDLESRQSIMQKFTTVLSRDFRGFLLKSVIDFINETAKRYARYVFDNDQIEFQLDGNNIDIIMQGKEYEMLSGGERQKLDLILQFSIREMLCIYLGFSSNIIILDEVMDFLDSDGCDAVINLIQNALADVSSVFVVTHHTDLSLPCDTTITVVKDATGVSHIA